MSTTSTFHPTVEGDTPREDDERYYVKLPGGAIGQREDGTGVHMLYGAPVPLDELNAATLKRLTTFADTTFRGTDADPNSEALAHARTALANGGQVNSGSSPVPGNYAELDEDSAAALVRSMELYPQSQAAVLIAETLFHGKRQKVMDSASEAARISAQLQIEAAGALQRQIDAGGGHLAPTPTPTGDVYAGGDPAVAARILALQDTEARQAVAPQPFGSDPTPAAGATPVGGGGSASNALQEFQEQRAAAEGRAKAAADALADEQRRTIEQAAEIARLQALVDDRGLHGDGGDASAKVAATEAPDDYSGFSYKQLQLYVDQHRLTGVAKNVSREKLEEAIKAVDGHDKPQTPPLPEDTDPASLKPDDPSGPR